MSSWQIFFWGVVNVRILGVVNVRLANNLTPREGHLVRLYFGVIRPSMVSLKIFLLLDQDLVAPAQYWHDPFNQTHFLVKKKRRQYSFVSEQVNLQSGSHYLADLNNEREAKNETYKEVATRKIKETE